MYRLNINIDNKLSIQVTIIVFIIITQLTSTQHHKKNVFPRRTLKSGRKNICFHVCLYIYFTCICSKGTSKVNDSLQYGLRVHFLIDVFFFFSLFPFCISAILTYGSERPPTSIFFKFLASSMTTVSLPAVGTQRREKQISPSLLSLNFPRKKNIILFSFNQLIAAG